MTALSNPELAMLASTMLILASTMPVITNAVSAGELEQLRAYMKFLVQREIVDETRAKKAGRCKLVRGPAE